MTAWSDLHEACGRYVEAFNTDDEDGEQVKAAIAELSRLLPAAVEVAQPAPQEPRTFQPGDIVRNKRTSEQLTVTEDGIWSPEYYELVEPVAPQEPRRQCAWWGDNRQCPDWTQKNSDYCDHHTTLRIQAFGTGFARRESYLSSQDDWCNCQAIPGTANYPGPWHPKGDTTCTHREPRQPRVWNVGDPEPDEDVRLCDIDDDVWIRLEPNSWYVRADGPSIASSWRSALEYAPLTEVLSDTPNGGA